MTMLINGQPADLIPAQDRGLQYGDGLFETIAVRHQQPEYWQQHMSRLLDGCERLKIPAPDTEQLYNEATSLIAEQQQAVIKIIITRGVGGRGYQLPEHAQSHRIVSLHPWPDYSHINIQQGVTVRSCQTRLSIQPALAGVKHLNRLEQILARQEWNDIHIAEGIMLDTEGRVTEGVVSNLFFVDATGRLLTPELYHCGVNGIMRQALIQEAQDHSIEVIEKAIMEPEARACQAMFITNSLFGVWPVKRWNDTTYNFENSPVYNLITNFNNYR
ncbi:MAG: aminodeoxychorismate lyase [Gammaproteobacteria bacterium]|nr:aminodeoxychorismate lyase [Gammaproteobacteria bacterium]